MDKLMKVLVSSSLTIILLISGSITVLGGPGGGIIDSHIQASIKPATITVYAEELIHFE